MSSRVRIMLQDMSVGLAYTGRAAYEVLENLYKDWLKTQTPTKTLTSVWKRASAGFVSANPNSIEMFYNPVLDDMEWAGPGYYHKVARVASRPKPEAPKLPEGPRWMVALAMWEKAQIYGGDRYRLFVSRDNRKQGWRHSLCNPYFQGMGFKPRKAVPPKPKTKVKTSGRGYTGWLEDASFRLPAAPRTVPTQSGTAPAAPNRAVKPRVGIWT